MNDARPAYEKARFGQPAGWNGLEQNSIFGKKPPKIEKSQIERALASSRLVPAHAAQASRITDKRKSPRRKIWAPCRLTWMPHGSADGMCVDVSETGALIRFRNKHVVPSHLRLSCPRLNLNCDCEIVRLDGLDVSVRFLL